MDNKQSYIVDKVREFADEVNLIWSVEDSCYSWGFDITFSTKDYKYRKKQTLQDYDLYGRNWRMSVDARLQNIFAEVIRAFGLDTDRVDYNRMYTSTAELFDFKFKLYDTPSIKNVIFNDPATIVFWNDGTKTVVNAQDGDIFDPEKGLAMAISKKALGNKGNYCKTFKKWLPEEEVDEDMISYLEEKIKHLGQVLNEMNEKDK